MIFCHLSNKLLIVRKNTWEIMLTDFFFQALGTPHPPKKVCFIWFNLVVFISSESSEL